MSESKIHDLEAQVKVLQRKLENSKVLNAQSEQIARDALEREAVVVAACRKTEERLEFLDDKLQIARLKKSCDTIDREIEAKEKMSNELEYYIMDQRNIGWNREKRKTLQRLTADLNSSQQLRNGQGRLLSNLVDRQNHLEKMRNAAARGNVAEVKRLLALNVSVNIADSTGICAFKYACGQGHTDVVEEMISVADVNNVEGRWSPLHFAVKYNRIEVVDLLVRHNAKLYEVDECGEAPIHVACKNGNKEIMNVLIKGGANVDQLNGSGNSCLHISAKAESDVLGVEMASCLLECGADDKIKNLEGLTPYTIAKTRRMYGILQAFKDARSVKVGGA